MDSSYPTQEGDGVSTLQPESDFEHLVASTVRPDCAHWSARVLELCLGSLGRLQRLDLPSAF